MEEFQLEEQKITLSLPKLGSLNLEQTENKGLVYWLGLIPVFALALYIRTRNLPLLQGKYLIELDSYFFFRYAKLILEGNLPTIDYMRYVPIGTNIAANGAYTFFPKTMVFFYKMAHFFFANLSQIEWHIIYPPVITIIAAIFFFLFIKDLLNSYRIAFISTAFLLVIPAYLQRTGAGFADHESVAMLWMFISLWLFVLAWKSNSFKKYLPLSAASGLFAGMMAATWGGYIFLIYSIALSVFGYAVLNPKIKRKLIFVYGAWIILYAAGCIIFVVKNKIFGLPGAIMSLTLIFIALHLILHRFIKPEKFPYQILPLGISAVMAIPVLFFAKINVKDLMLQITKEGLGRVFYTVSENAQPYFLGDWWNSFGLIFLLAFIGSTFYFYELFKPAEESKLKLHWLAAIVYAIFFSAFIFGRFSTSSKHSSLVSFFSATYLYWLIGFLVLLGILYLLAYYKDRTHLENLENKWPWLLLVVWLLITLLAARGQVRLLFSAVPPIAIAAAVFISKLTDWAKSQQKVLKYSILIALVLISSAAFATAAQQTAYQNYKYSGSMTPGQWEAAMTFLREQTPEDSVVAHWWDYGYLTITVGERAAVTDGGNEKGWNHQSGRYFLTGKDANSTLTYLKTHNVTHILISDEEIMKYHAFSYIGSDENLDRRSIIGLFGLQETKEVRNGTLLIYGGGWPLDKDYLVGNLILPEGQAGVFGFAVPSDATSTQQTPQAFVIYMNRQYNFDVPCLVVQGSRTDFETNPNSTLNGCLVLVPYIQDQNTINQVGGAFWASEKVWDTNFARLYLYNETDPNFKLAYQDSTPLALYQGRPMGPIKIWEVRYPDNIKPDPFYLESSPHG
ncbi:MAG: STT3 domain-containing protein [Candidatus Nanoarchaeia archaeon]